MERKKTMNALIYVGIGFIVLGIIAIAAALVMNVNNSKNVPETTTISTTETTTESTTSTTTTTTTEAEETTKDPETTLLTIDNFRVIAKANKLTDISNTSDPGYNIAKNYAIAVGRKNSNGKYASAFEFYEFENKNDAEYSAVEWCSTRVSDLEDVKRKVILKEKDISEYEASSKDFYFRSYCDGNKLLVLSCTAKQKDNCIKIFNTMK